MLLAASSAAEGENASTFTIYPSAFHCDERGKYDAIVAAARWCRVLVLLHKTE